MTRVAVLAIACMLLVIGDYARAQSGGDVKQSGVVTRDHGTKWIAPGVVGDSGGYMVGSCAPLPLSATYTCATITTSARGCLTIASGSCGTAPTHFLLLQVGGHLLLQGGGSVLLQSN